MRAFLAASAVALAPLAINQGTITVNQGTNGVTLGMARSTVIALLGKPVYKNANGLLQYGPNSGPVIFDVYLNTATNRVRLISISGSKFCTTAGVCMLKNGGIAKLKAQYGTKLKLVKTEDGEQLYQVNGTFGQKKVFTSFAPAPHGQIIQIFIGYL